MEFIFCRKNSTEVKNLLDKMSSQFNPSLASTLDIDEYATKLARNAKFLLCIYDGDVVGCIIFYTNISTSILYLPIVWVDSNYRGQAIAKKMFQAIIPYGKTRDINCIDLEVLKNNEIAYNLYKSLGFINIENRGSKILMRYYLTD